jgi:hypothetical protein
MIRIRCIAVVLFAVLIAGCGEGARTAEQHALDSCVAQSAAGGGDPSVPNSKRREHLEEAVTEAKSAAKDDERWRSLFDAISKLDEAQKADGYSSKPFSDYEWNSAAYLDGCKNAGMKP